MDELIEGQTCKTDGGKCYPKSDYAFCPDESLPSTWKIRLTKEPGGPPDSGIVGAAIAALGKGFRGQKAQIPSEDLPQVKAKVRAAWKKANPDKDPSEMPDVIKQSHTLIITPRLMESVEGSSGSRWGVVLIESGMSLNKHMYKPDVLRTAAPLFEGVKAYVDHDDLINRQKYLPERSVRDIAGWYSDVRYQDGSGVVGVFTIAESQDWLKKLMLQAYKQKQDLFGFSIVADGKTKIVKENNEVYYEVESIDRALSCDVVTQPAAGGRIKELLEAQRQQLEEEITTELDSDESTDTKIDEVKTEEVTEPEVTPTEEPKPEETKVEESKVEEAQEAANQTTKEEVKVGEENEKMTQTLKEADTALNALNIATTRLMLREKLSESDLPKVIKDKIAKTFSDKIVTADEVDAAITGEKTILESLIKDPESPFKPRVREMQAPEDTIAKALDGMIDGAPVDGVTPFRSIKEAFAVATGRSVSDVMNEPGLILKESLGYSSVGRDNGRLKESATTATWAELLGDSITRKMIKEFNGPGLDDWRKVCSDIVSVNDFRTQRRIRFGGYGVIPTVNEGADYQALTTPGDEEVTYAVVKKGGLEDLTIETITNDDLGALKRIPTRLARAAKITLYRYVFDLITANPTQPDGTAAYHANHNNLGATALSSATLTTARQTMRNQTTMSNTIDFLQIAPKYLLVPNELEQVSWLLYNNPMDIDTVGGTPSTTNMNFNAKSCEPIVVDYWTDADDWYLVADPRYAPTLEMAFLGGKQEPELFTQDQPNVGSVWSADKISYKIRHIYAGVLLDWRSFYAAVV